MPLSGDLEPANWRTSAYSIGNGECVEVASVSGNVVVRDSKDPSGSIICYPAPAWRAFVINQSLGSKGTA